METILWLFAGHFIGDFSFQSQWMASQKGKSWEVNLYHALVYTATVFIVAALGGIPLISTGNRPYSGIAFPNRSVKGTLEYSEIYLVGPNSSSVHFTDCRSPVCLKADDSLARFFRSQN